MVNSVVSKRKIKSSWARFFHFLLYSIIVGVVAYFVLILLTNQQEKKTEKFVSKNESGMEALKKKFGNNEVYEKYNYSEYINSKYNSIPWSTRISLIVDKVKELKSMSYEGSNAIILSDFSVTLDKLSLKGKVSNLVLLYRSSKNKRFKNLIEMFRDLDFVKDVKIQTYKSNGDMIEFVLDANLTLADGNVQK